MKHFIQSIFQFIKKYQRLIQLVFLASVGLFVVNQLTAILHGMTWQELKLLLFGQSKKTLLAMIGVGLLAVLPLLTYDWVTIQLLEDEGEIDLSFKERTLTAWMINTLNNFIGFGGVIGATLRGKFYGKNHDVKRVVAIVSKVALFMLTGLSFLSFLTWLDLVFWHSIHVFAHYRWWLLAGALYLPGLLIFIYFRRQTLFKEFRFYHVFELVLGSTGQWTFALAYFFFIGKLLQLNISFLHLYPLFVVATLIGMLTMVPGGMGTFDVLMIMGLSSLGVSREQAVVWLLFYRLFYFVLPFLTGLLTYLYQTGSRINQFFDDMPKMLTSKFAHAVMVVLLYISGIIMVLIGTIPNVSQINRFMTYLFSFSFNFLDQTLNMLVGFILIGLARGVANKVKAAYWPTVIILMFSVVNTLTRTMSFKLVFFYLFVLVCLFLSRHQFYRQQLVYSWEALVTDGILYGLLLILYSVIGYFNRVTTPVKDELAHYIYFPSEEVWFQGLQGILLAFFTLLILYHYLGGEQLKPGEAFDADKWHLFQQKWSRTLYMHTPFIQNKRLFYFEKDQQTEVLIMFELKANRVFVLGNPMGNQMHVDQALMRFLEEVDRLGYEAVFYNVSSPIALTLHDHGYEFIKIGEEGVIDLATYEDSVAGNNCSDDLTFNLLSEDEIRDVAYHLHHMVRDWEKQHQQSFYSSAHLKMDALIESGVGVAMRQDEIVGFVTLKQLSYRRMSYELLFIKNDAPEETGHFLVNALIHEIKERGFHYFSLGFTPLANVGKSDYSFAAEKTVNLLYRYSSPQSGFQPIRRFKTQYVTDWHPAYLSYKKRRSLMMIAWQLHRLITGHNIFSKNPVEVLMEEEKQR
ncbi:bifunctional lysylphosphatidylglycerol flippase/synthetase MprF [Vagococcus lutrae]|uniref:bifunctional lysylphosphatidylglycerol flippase/synthetase MprF n=1 Tax=Vagococcus lutrae TaxID=81947 RepID=UPI0023A97576|nr:bifunctional lysylphosphatidylglycerol flippase/synthetase MprF [Vagococcus lutrae]WEB80707.1 bifunctional lysylphosphatidylglycerol flippase/synthetase MprF [Vagococcus lutrae]